MRPSKHKKKKAFKRKVDMRRIKKDMSYFLSEVCELLCVHKRTVYQWLKTGLPKVDNQKPYLVRGRDLYDFLKQKRKGQKCQPHEFYCFKCKGPQSAWENIVDLMQYNDKQLMIQGLCAVCGTKVNKLGFVRRKEGYEKLFVVLELRQRRLRDTTNTSSTCDKKGVDAHDSKTL